jgi:hypothetical protein
MFSKGISQSSRKKDIAVFRKNTDGMREPDFQPRHVRDRFTQITLAAQEDLSTGKSFTKLLTLQFFVTELPDAMQSRSVLRILKLTL